jgi:hypothetical protein
MNLLDKKVLNYIELCPGITAIQLAKFMREGNEPVYDRHRAVSWSIARLRASGRIQDVPRCGCCGRALTRNHRNVPLQALETQK